jgi:hypothetical protein
MYFMASSLCHSLVRLVLWAAFIEAMKGTLIWEACHN